MCEKGSDKAEFLEEKYQSDAYSRFVCRNPWRAWVMSTSLIISFVLVGVLIVLTLQDFTLSGATVGFENRGTPIAGKIMSILQIGKLECTGELSLRADGSGSTYFSGDVVMENDDPQEINADTCYSGYSSSSRRRLLSEPALQNRNFQMNRPEERELAYGAADWYGQKYPPLLVSPANNWAVMENSKEGMSILFSGDDLWTKDAIIGMCSRLTAVESVIADYDNICNKQTVNTGEELCKPPRSIGHYIAALKGRDSCEDITDTDVAEVKNLLTTCRPFFDDGSLVGNCWNYEGGTNNGTYTTMADSTTGNPMCSLAWGYYDCAEYNAVYDIFYSLTPSNYLRSDNGEALEYAQILTSEEIDDRASFLEIYYNELLPMTGETIGGAMCEVVYADIKGEVFSDQMPSEAPLFVILFFCVFALLVYHTGSYWIASCSIFQIMMAFGWGFVFYCVIAWRTFFPFLNLIALFLVLGVGADDVFVFVDAWKQSFVMLPENCPLDSRLSWVLNRAGTAMLVTTVTTASSFFANMIAPISALKAFGLFTGMVIVADFCLMFVFIPATVVVHHLYFSVDAGRNQLKHRQNPCFVEGCYGCTLPFPDEPKASPAQTLTIKPTSAITIDNEDNIKAEYFQEKEMEVHNCCCMNCCCCVSSMNPDFCDVPRTRDKSGRLHQRWGENIFEFYVSPTILHDILRWIFFAITVALTITVGLQAFNLERPTSNYMQLLDSMHPLEIYEKTYMKIFDIEGGDSFMFPYYIVAGLDPVDNGDSFNPSSRGSPIYIDLDISSAESQQWGYDMCTTVSDWSGSPQSGNSLETNPCVFYWFKQWMEANCAASGGNSVDSQWLVYMPARNPGGCCGKVNSDFPYDKNVFDTCIAEFANHWAGQNVNHGLWFDSSGNLKVVMVQGETTTKYSQAYEVTDAFYKTLLEFGETIATGPTGSGLDKSWISTELRFYALQQAITEGAYQSAGLSTILAFSVLILLTRRLLSSIFAALQIACVVACTVGVFVYLGWELNVVESIILAVAVGLACDFSGHMAHAFNDSHTHLEISTLLRFPRNFEELANQYSLATTKATEAMTTLGVTITLGFVTTFCSGIVLMGGSLYFFQQFGIFMVTLMSFSYVFVFFMLMPFLGSFGWVDRLLADFVLKNLPDAIRPSNHKFSLSALVKEASTSIEMASVPVPVPVPVPVQDPEDAKETPIL